MVSLELRQPLQDDPKEILRASRDAEKIHGFVMEFENKKHHNQVSQNSKFSAQTNIHNQILQSSHVSTQEEL